MSFRQTIKNVSFIRTAYYHVLWVRNSVLTFFTNFGMRFFKSRDFQLLQELRKEVRVLYPERVSLTNDLKFYAGKNILGYPAMTFIKKEGKNIGWEEGRISLGDTHLTIMQLETDRQINFPNFFAKYKPTIIVDFGTASGGTAVYFYNQASQYCQPQLLSIDIWDRDFVASKDFHEKNRTTEKARFVFGKSTLECVSEVSQFLSHREPGDRVFFSFDDLHTYEHTFLELETFAPLLQSGDVIIMQDTWNQGLYGNETSPMLAVHKFLKSHPDFALDTDFCKSMTLPCNFIYGIIVKK